MMREVTTARFWVRKLSTIGGHGAAAWNRYWSSYRMVRIEYYCRLEGYSLLVTLSIHVKRLRLLTITHFFVECDISYLVNISPINQKTETSELDVCDEASPLPWGSCHYYCWRATWDGRQEIIYNQCSRVLRNAETHTTLSQDSLVRGEHWAYRWVGLEKWFYITLVL